ncbi:protein translocase subunit SecD [Motilimonas sp. 1_MG-2023]|uniref:protein translocase subunit SecD n=1 Tax=Motilimonas TaxID=1914248 RepID=UPI0026E390D5|nr:protein translocase subunit SecD [Motilimonas sp. 1_MG-2023]MDO6524473.1 protein translocase subunit SecD [Motilimonas sp. 1_MG-2023]
MLNKYPLWKYIMVICVITIGLLYATPNLYGEDPAVQVSGKRGAEVELSTVGQINDALSQANIAVKSAALEEGKFLVRLVNRDDQLKAKELISELLGAQFTTALNLAPATPAWLEALGAGPLKLGLDLRGGVHFLMEVDMDAAIAKAKEQMVSDFRSELREEKIRYRGVREDAQNNGVILRFADEATRGEAETFLKPKYPGFVFEDDESEGVYLLKVSMSEDKLKETKNYALEQNITIIRNRVNQLGVAEPQVQRQGSDRIVVELPGVQDTAQAKEILGATAMLEFRLVDDKTDVRDAVAGRLPSTSQVYKNRDGQPYVLQKQIMLTGDHIVGARSSMDEYSRPQVNIDLDSQGGSKMSRVTKNNINKPMATLFIEWLPTGKEDENGKRKLVKHEEIINVATIQAQLGRSFRITGIDNPAEAHNLALLLRAGALIAPIQIVEERTIGPSMGQQNIDNGMAAMMYGMAAVVIFMAIYYRAFGLVANVALLINIVMIVGIMSMVPGATLTLPGIAGIVLTVGMAVDANVLIFERIREELLDGKSVQKAINEGYGNAFSTIADANITTLITAFILFAVGTGPVKGFAVTLMIGIATSMFTSIVGTRAIVNLLWGGKRLKKLSI